MSVTSTTNRVDYTGNGATSVYSYPFKITDEDHLLVTVRDTDDDETTYVITTDYTVSGVGDASGGNVTLVAGALTSGYRLTIRRVVPVKQLTDIRNQGTFYPEAHEDAFDYLTYIDQQQQTAIDRAMVLPETYSASDIDTELPIPIASTAIGWNADGDGLANITSLTGTAVSAFMATVLDDTTSSNALTTLGFSTYAKTLIDDTTAAATRTTLGFASSGEIIVDGDVNNSVRFQSPSQFNGALAVSVGSNAMTIALKDRAGSDASSTSPVYCSFGSSTLSTGTYTRRSATAALSTVISNGSTLGLASAVEDYIQVYLLDNAGTLELCYHGGNAVLSEDALHSTTAEGGGGAADTRYTLYSTTARTNVRIRHIATLRGTWTSGAYAAVPTAISLNSGRVGKCHRHEILLQGNTGHGSTNTKIRRFTNLTTTGTAMTATQSAANGDSITVNEEGIYSMAYLDKAGGGVEQVGISKNSNELTTSFFSITQANQLGGIQASAGANGLATVITRLVPGDVIRGHTAGGADSVNALFRMTKISD